MIVDILTSFVSNSSGFKDILNLDIGFQSFSSMEKTHIEIETNNMGNSASYICNHMIICHRGSPQLPPAVCLADGLAEDHCDRLFAQDKICPRW